MADVAVSAAHLAFSNGPTRALAYLNAYVNPTNSLTCLSLVNSGIRERDTLDLAVATTALAYKHGFADIKERGHSFITEVKQMIPQPPPTRWERVKDFAASIGRMAECSDEDFEEFEMIEPVVPQSNYRPLAFAMWGSAISLMVYQSQQADAQIEPVHRHPRTITPTLSDLPLPP